MVLVVVVVVAAMAAAAPAVTSDETARSRDDHPAGRETEQTGWPTAMKEASAQLCDPAETVGDGGRIGGWGIVGNFDV